MDQTKGLIFATVGVVGAVTLVQQMEGKRPITFRSYLGDWFLGIFLTGIAMADERLARNFCLLIIFATLLKDGGNIFAFAGNTASAVAKPVPPNAPGVKSTGNPGQPRNSSLG